MDSIEIVERKNKRAEKDYHKRIEQLKYQYDHYDNVTIAKMLQSGGRWTAEYEAVLAVAISRLLKVG